MDSATATEMFLCLYHSVSENSLFKFEFHAEFLTFSQGYLKYWDQKNSIPLHTYNLLYTVSWTSLTKNQGQEPCAAQIMKPTLLKIFIVKMSKSIVACPLSWFRWLKVLRFLQSWPSASVCNYGWPPVKILRYSTVSTLWKLSNFYTIFSFHNNIFCLLICFSERQSYYIYTVH